MKPAFVREENMSRREKKCEAFNSKKQEMNNHFYNTRKILKLSSPTVTSKATKRLEEPSVSARMKS